MRYRALDANGDYTFGRSQGNFLLNTPECVAQSALTRLRLLQGEWFLDVQEGTPWTQEILVHDSQVYDLIIQNRVLQTQGMVSIVNYQSSVNQTTRKLSVKMLILTAYSTQPMPLEVTL